MHYIFDKVLPHFVKDNVGIDVIGVGDVADYVEQYLDLPVVWETWKKRINCLALVGGLHPVWEWRSKDFATEFLKNVRIYFLYISRLPILLSPLHIPFSYTPFSLSFLTCTTTNKSARFRKHVRMRHPSSPLVCPFQAPRATPRRQPLLVWAV